MLTTHAQARITTDRTGYSVATGGRRLPGTPRFILGPIFL
jgi:hypothetical protein